MKQNNIADFIIAGSPKSGSSLLYHLLSKRSEVSMSADKEPNVYYKYWDEQEQISLFPNEHFSKLKGEASVGYFDKKEVPGRIHKTNPRTRLIFCLRNPIERTHSHYWHGVKGGYEKRSWQQAIKEPKLPEYLFSYSLYFRNLQYFSEYFRREQIHIFFLEDFQRDPVGTTNKVNSFLGLHPEDRIDTRKQNEGKHFRNVRLHHLLHSLKRNRNLIPAPLRNLGKGIYFRLIRKNTQEGPIEHLSDTDRVRLADIFREDVRLLEATYDVVCPWADFK